MDKCCQTLLPCWGLSRPVFALEKAVAQHGPQINVCKIWIWRIQRICEICEAPIPDIPLDLFSCQNVHYKAFHCKHELDTWNQQTTAIGTITEVACKKLQWISSQNWKRDVWNFWHQKNDIIAKKCRIPHSSYIILVWQTSYIFNIRLITS